MTSVFLVDDHEIVRRGVAELISREPDLDVVGEVGGALGALEAITAAKPDVAVIDVRLGDGSGITVCRDVRSHLPATACLILTSFDDDQALVDAAMAGAAGYVLKQIRGNELVSSIRQVALGHMLLDKPTVRAGLDRLKAQEAPAIETLTAQEQRIFELIGEGKSNREIAADMFLAEKTVKNYVSNLLAKLGMSRRTEAAAFAARLDERQRQSNAS